MYQNQDSGTRNSCPLLPCVSLRGGALPAMVSYAQNLEDVMIRRALQDISRGFYVDIGAYEAVTDSVTCWFYQNGWRGVNVEPNPALHARLQSDRPEDVNLCCAIGAESGSLPFNVISDTGLSTLVEQNAVAALAEGYPTSSRPVVDVQTLNQLLESSCAGRVVDFLKIDVEGSEAEIINAASFSTHRPRLLIIEAVRPFTLEPAWLDWESALIGQRYEFAWFDGLNRFYVREEDAWRLKLLGIPPGLFDNFRSNAHVLAVEQLQHQQKLNSELCEAVAGVAIEVSAFEHGLHAQIDNAAGDLALRERAHVEVTTRCEALRVRILDIASPQQGREGPLTSAAGACAVLPAEAGALEVPCQSEEAEG